MASDKLLGVIQSEATSIADELDADTLDRILIEPHQEALAEAMLADVVDVTPIVGDLAAAVRQHRAEQQGVEFPDQPAYIENTIGDFPKPIDTIADIVVSQNVLLYLKRKHDIDLAATPNELTEEATQTTSQFVDEITPN